MGRAHAAPAPSLRASPSSPSRITFLSLLVLLLLLLTPSSSQNAATDAEALVKFRSSLTHNEAIPNWDPSTPPCSGDPTKWVGVICYNGTVWGLQLENMGLGGNIDVDALAKLDHLRTISLANNKFEGPIPDMRRLTKLRSVYLTNNRFSGEIPNNWFLGMNALRRLFLGNNSFVGNVPTSLTTLPRLVELRIDGNRFQGRLPNFEPVGPLSVNAANNQLEGPIPPSLSNSSANSFSGNKGLCGPPLGACTDSGTSGSTSNPTAPGYVPYGTRITIIILSVFLALVILLLIIVAVLFFSRRQRSNVGRTMSSNRQYKLASYDGNQVASAPPQDYYAETKRAEQGKLVFLREDRDTFDLSELLRASAEVLGSGNFGSSYKAVMFGGRAIVVKRFRQMNKVGRQEFYEHMRRMGRLRHRNVLPVVACYYRREEKLLICNFADGGSLASHLHGNRNMNYPGLDWCTRLRIIKGVARGLAYLYSELPSLTLPHGHLKSSNVLLDASFEPLLTDYALVPLINPEQAQQLMVAYKSPEYESRGHIAKNTDVWSLGILILEMLTGKFPTNYLAVGNVKGSSLAIWVNAIASELEQGGHQLFDKEMEGTEKNCQVEMRKLLGIGLRCCEEDVDTRWSIKEAVDNIEKVKERDD
ncbi:hypothetical protein Dimus_027310 [Dionaea muscipula]